MGPFCSVMGLSASSAVRSKPSTLFKASDAQLQLIIDEGIFATALTSFSEAKLRQLHDRHVELQDNKSKILDEDDPMVLLDQKYDFNDFAVQMILREGRKASRRPITLHECRGHIKRKSSRIMIWVADDTLRGKED